MAFVPVTINASDFNANVLVGAKLFLYAADGVTPQAGYRDITGGSAHTNPVICNAGGAEVVWLDDSLTYRLILQDAAEANTYFNQEHDPSVNPTGLIIYPQAQGDQGLKTTDSPRFNVARVTALPADADDDRVTTAAFVNQQASAAQAAAISAAEADATAKANASSTLANNAQATADTADAKASSALQQLQDFGATVLASTAPIDNGDFSATTDAVDLGGFA